MRGVVQRVRRASVSVEGRAPRSIGTGVVLLVGVGRDDGEDASRWLAEKTAHLRIFPDGEGKLNRSLLEVQGDALVVSQFTLYGDVRKGRRPSFVEAAAPETAERLYLQVAKELESIGVTNVETGTFQTHMVLSLENDGPVTILLESPPR